MLESIDWYNLIIASLIDALSGIIKNGFYIILFIWGLRKVVKEMPNWIHKFFDERQTAKTIERAISQRKQF